MKKTLTESLDFTEREKNSTLTCSSWTCNTEKSAIIDRVSVQVQRRTATCMLRPCRNALRLCKGLQEAGTRVGGRKGVRGRDGKKGFPKLPKTTPLDAKKSQRRRRKKLLQVRSSGTHVKTLKKHDLNNTRWSHDERQRNGKSLCTGLVPAQKPSARASLSLPSVSPFLSLSEPHNTRQTNNVTLASRVCTVAPVRVLLRARSDEYPCPRRVESRVGQGGRE